MSRSIERCTVVRTDDIDPETAVVRYRETATGWEVKTPKDAEFRSFARGEAEESDVLQLIAEKWDARFGDPDRFERDVEIETTQGTLDDLGGQARADGGATDR
ncbi:MAG: hypothetical protein ABEJ68_07630 [Halobacteriaceae archaeon]